MPSAELARSYTKSSRLRATWWRTMWLAFLRSVRDPMNGLYSALFSLRDAKAPGNMVSGRE